MKALDKRHDNIRLLQKVGTIIASFSDTLRAAAINIDGITVVCDQFSCSKQVVRVVCCKLDYKGSVLYARCEHLLSVFWVCSENSGVKHRRVAELCTIFASKHTIRQLRLVDHGCNDVLGRSNRFIPVVAVRLFLLACLHQ